MDIVWPGARSEFAKQGDADRELVRLAIVDLRKEYHRLRVGCEASSSLPVVSGCRKPARTPQRLNWERRKRGDEILSRKATFVNLHVLDDRYPRARDFQKRPETDLIRVCTRATE